ncbi:MAG: TM2 domain-containing protein [bacterium]
MPSNLVRKFDLTPQELEIFKLEFGYRRRSHALAYALFLLVGVLGGHRFYLRSWAVGFVYLILTAAATVLGAIFKLTPLIKVVGSIANLGRMSKGLSLLAVVRGGSQLAILCALAILFLIDLVMLGGQVESANERVENSILDSLWSIRHGNKGEEVPEGYRLTRNHRR